MDDIIIRSGKFEEVASSSSSLPLGIEYEEIQRKLKEHTYKKYNLPIDKRTPPKNVILSPKQMIEYETNMFSVYPQDNIPYQESGAWIGGYNE